MGAPTQTDIKSYVAPAAAEPTVETSTPATEAVTTEVPAAVPAEAQVNTDQPTAE